MANGAKKSILTHCKTIQPAAKYHPYCDKGMIVFTIPVIC